jgi:hypothetical protein
MPGFLDSGDKDLARPRVFQTLDEIGRRIKINSPPLDRSRARRVAELVFHQINDLLLRQWLFLWPREESAAADKREDERGCDPPEFHDDLPRLRPLLRREVGILPQDTTAVASAMQLNPGGKNLSRHDSSLPTLIRPPGHLQAVAYFSCLLSKP